MTTILLARGVSTEEEEVLTVCPPDNGAHPMHRGAAGTAAALHTVLHRRLCYGTLHQLSEMADGVCPLLGVQALSQSIAVHERKQAIALLWAILLLSHPPGRFMLLCAYPAGLAALLTEMAL